MARKFKDGDIVRVKKEARPDVREGMEDDMVKCFTNTKWFAVVTDYSTAGGCCPYQAASGKSGAGAECWFDAKELELVRRP